MPYKDPLKRAECKRRYVERHPDRVRESKKKYQDKNRDILNAKRREKSASDPEYRRRRSEYQKNRKIERRKALREWYAKNRERIVKIQLEAYYKTGGMNHKPRRSVIAKKYGLSLEAYDALISIDMCPICTTAITPPKTIHAVVIDHCHKTGKVRNGICNSCNLILGYAKDSVETLKRCIAYLEYHK